jgi:uncharacterized delta-60 repeat protein
MRLVMFRSRPASRPFRHFLVISAFIASLAACGGGGSPAAPASGSLDSSFGSGGIVTTAIGLDANGGGVVAVQSDGKVVQAGHCKNGTAMDFCLARYNADGSLDAGFGTSGKVMVASPGTGTRAIVRGIALQSDGKIVVAGQCGNGSDFPCAMRFNADGSVDTGFGGSGRVLVSTGMNTGGVYRVLVQSDGGILLAGGCTNAANQNRFCLIRLLSSGTLDAGFGAAATGVVMVTVGSTSTSHASGMALQSDGKPVLAGECQNGGVSLFCMARFTVAGDLDSSFGTGGTLIDSVLSGNHYVFAIAALPSGRLLVSGSCQNNSLPVISKLCAVRYNSDGSIDGSFGSLGKVAWEISPGASDITLQGDGKIVTVGTVSGGAGDNFGVARLNADGSLDSAFGSGGSTIFAPGTGVFDRPSRVGLQADGKIVVGGECYVSGSSIRRLCLARLHP